MQKYNWDLQELFGKRQRLLDILPTSTGEIKREILASINTYTEIIESFLVDKELTFDIDTKEVNYSKRGQNLSILSSFYFSYSSLEADIHDLLSPTTNFFSKETFKDLEIPTLSSSVSNQIDFTYSFAQDMLNHEILSYWQYLLEEKSTNFQFQAKMNITDDFNGLTYYLPYTKDFYVNIWKNNTFLDLVVLPHELFHVYHFYKSNCRPIIVGQSNSYIQEVDGCFSNLLATNYLRQNGKVEEARQIDLWFLLNYFEQILDIITGISLSYGALDHSIYSFYTFEKKFEEFGIKCPYDTKEEAFATLTEPDPLINNSLSYLVALELEEIYKQDKKEAIKLLELIKDFHDPSQRTLSFLNSLGIDPRKDNYKVLKKNIEYLK